MSPLPSPHCQIGDGKILTPTLGEAVASGLVNNETLAYYMGRTFLYLQRVRRWGGRRREEVA